MANFPGGLPIPAIPSSVYPTQAVEVLAMENDIYYIKPEETPILTILNELGKEPCNLHEFMWPEDEHYRMSFGKAKMTYLGDLTTVGGGVYHFAKLHVQHQIERQAFRESLSLVVADNGTEAISAQAGNTAYYDVFKVKFAANTLNTNEVTDCYVLSSRFAEQNATVIAAGVWHWDASAAARDQAVMIGTDAAKSKQPVISSRGEVYVMFFVNPTTMANFDEVTYFPFETRSPTDEAGAWQEGTGLGGRTSKRSRFKWAHTEITKTVSSASGTVIAEIGLGGETQQLRDRAASAAEHKLGIEKKVLYRTYATGRGTDTRGMRGLGMGWDGVEQASDGDTPWIVSKNGSYDTRFQWNIGAAAAEDDLFALWDMMEYIWEDRSANDITFLVSPRFNNIINKLLYTTNQAYMLYDPGMTMAGLSIQHLKTPNGTVNWMVHNSIRGPWEDYCLALNFDDIVMRPLNGRDTQLWLDCEPKSIDGQVDYFLTETSVVVKREWEHAILKLNY